MQNYIKEKEYKIPCLKIIKDNPGISTSQIIKKIKSEHYVILSDGDLEIIKGRKDQRYTQILRNLLGSHIKDNDFGKLVSFSEEQKDKQFEINDEGLAFLNSNEDENLEENFLIQNSIEYSDSTDLNNANNRTPIATTSNSTSYQRDYKLAKTAIKNSNYNCEYAAIEKLNHTTFNKQNGFQYVEAHHLYPLGFQKDFLPINLDRLENIVALCPNCHRAVHYANLITKRKILKPLFDERTPSLIQIDNKFDCSFTHFINNFYS